MSRALLVDLDGTLADSIPHLKRVFFDFLSFYDIEATEEEFNFFNGTSLSVIIHELKGKYALEPTHEALFLQYEHLIFNDYTAHVKPMSQAVETLRLAKQKQIALALVTSAPDEIAHLFLTSNNLNDLFEVLICGRVGEPAKPHPALYLRALNTLNVTAQEAIAIEDSVNGVNSALSAGCEVFWLTAHETLAYDEQIHCVRNWHEIKKWVEAI